MQNAKGAAILKKQMEAAMRANEKTGKRPQNARQF